MLAKFGAFLAAGLCINTEAHAQLASPGEQRAIIPHLPSDRATAVVIKFYQPEANGEYLLLEELDFQKGLFGGPLPDGTSITVKIDRSTSKTWKLNSAVNANTIKWSAASYTVKLRGTDGMLLPAVQKIIKCDVGTPGVILSSTQG